MSPDKQRNSSTQDEPTRPAPSADAGSQRQPRPVMSTGEGKGRDSPSPKTASKPESVHNEDPEGMEVCRRCGHEERDHYSGPNLQWCGGLECECRSFKVYGGPYDVKSGTP